MELQRLAPTGKPVYYITENADAADTVSTDELWPGGSTGLNLSGSGITVGEWDGGAVLATHQELSGRVSQQDGETTVSYHATHVAGTIIASGVDPNAKGMAFAANLDAYNWTDDEGEMAAAAADENGLTLSNHSYGIITGWTDSYSVIACNKTWYWFGENGDTEDYNFGYYNDEAQAWDQIAFDAPHYLIVKSAGNDRNDFAPDAGDLDYPEYCKFDASTKDWVVADITTDPRDDDCGPNGYDCISTKATAKNILTVGAVGDINGGYNPSGEGSQVVMSTFSAWGPTDDGRIKPDIVANGVILWSSYGGNDNDYDNLSGTSTAAPNATGSLLLLQQHYQNTHSGNSMRSATLKALAIHTADEAGPSDGPDYSFGWGLLNTKKGAEVISSDGGGSHKIIEATLNNTGTYQESINAVAGSGIKISATLVWTDPPGTPPAPSVDQPDLMLINDLDLRIIGNNTTYFPWKLNPSSPAVAATTGDNIRDNVEQVSFEPIQDGFYTVQVTHKGTLKAANPQNFSLIISYQPAQDQYRFPWEIFLPAINGR